MKQGFTLIELLVVVAIIGVMMAGALMNIHSGRDAARVRDASRGVAQMVHYANALALLRQRPVILTYSTVHEGDDDTLVARLDVRLSGEAMAVAASAEPADPIYREVNGQDTTENGAEAVKAEADSAEAGGGDDIGGTTTAEKAGIFFTRKILDPDELAKEDATRAFDGMSISLEMLGEDGAQLDDRSTNDLREQAQGLLNNRVTAVKAWSNTSGEIDTAEEQEPDRKDTESEPAHVIFETNGTCQPHRVILRMRGEDGKEEGLVITVSRSAKVIIGDADNEDRRR
ncbi:MAG: type II secretion system GspH family protein [Kiritimatiellae bacterium]|nr:type II secretion system GspH family protein [Kiritimatiellia bacterium]